MSGGILDFFSNALGLGGDTTSFVNTDSSLGGLGDFLGNKYILGSLLQSGASVANQIFAGRAASGAQEHEDARLDKQLQQQMEIAKMNAAMEGAAIANARKIARMNAVGQASERERAAGEDTVNQYNALGTMAQRAFLSRAG
jgi:hypothetical protein